MDLPLDLQRLMGQYVNDKNLSKIPWSFMDRPDDIFWKERYERRYRKKKNINNYREAYEKKIYDLRILKQGWNDTLIERCINDEIFLKRHIDARDWVGSTMLFHLCLTMAAYSHNKTKRFESYIVKLIKHGSDVNTKTDRVPLMSCTPLLIVSGQKNTEFKYRIMRLLLEAGADVNVQDQYNVTPLMKTVAARGDALQIVKLLIEFNANIRLKNTNGYDALFYMEKRTNDAYTLSDTLVYNLLL